MRVIRLHSIHDLQGTIRQDDFSATLRQSILTILSLTLHRMVATLVVVSGGSTKVKVRYKSEKATLNKLFVQHFFMLDILQTKFNKVLDVYSTNKV